MAGSVLPAIFGPAGRNTGLGRRTGALSSTWCASSRTAISTGPERLGERDRAAGDAQSGLVRCLGRVLANQAAVGLGLESGSCGTGVEKWSLRAPCGVGASGGTAEQRTVTGMVLHGTGGSRPEPGGKRQRCGVSKPRIRPMLANGRRRAESRLSPVVLFAPCFALVGAPPALLSRVPWSVEPLLRLAALPPLWSAGALSRHLRGNPLLAGAAPSGSQIPASDESP